MPITEHCDLYSSVHEDGVNNIVLHIMRQRPSLFNYGTALFDAHPELLCQPVNVAQAVIDYANPLITVENPLPVLGTNGAVAVDFCFQITQVEIDFHPGTITLPSELSPPLTEQKFTIHARVCGGIGCPSDDIIDKLPPLEPTPPPQVYEPPPLPQTVLPPRKLNCFCLDVFVVGHIEVKGLDGNKELLGKVDGLEIVDITPEGLENSLECYLNLLIRLVILPRTRIAIGTMVYNILDLATITLSPTPTPSEVPNNPAIEDDQLKIFINVGVSP